MATEKAIKPVALICEDEEDIRRIMELSLVAEGFEVHVTGTLKNLEEHLNRLRPQVLVLDIMLPGSNMDGMDMCRHLKSQPRHAPTKILLCSAIARGTAHNEEEFQKATGADDVLFKPFDPQELRRRVKALAAGTKE